MSCCGCALFQPNRCLVYGPALELAEALISPVRWRDTMTTLDSLGVEQYVDVGSGRVQSKLATRCIRGASAATAETFLEGISAPV
jgi:malonyl CoA-acyl carrier protein transacylase